MLKDKGKPAVPTRARGPRGRRRRPEETLEAADSEPQAATLETCRGLLTSILTHWGPAHRGPEDSAGPESDAPGLAATAASLVARWVLRSVAERPPGRAEPSGLLGWLESHILPQPAVVAELLADGATRRSLFKLHSRACSAERLAGPAQGAACGFNAALLRLAAPGPAGSAFRRAVEALCLSSLREQDGATRGEAGSPVIGRRDAPLGLGSGAIPGF